MVEVVPVVPPGGRGGLEVDDDEPVAEEVELAALEDRQVSQVMLQPPCLRL